jgi:SpoIIAA-like
MLTVMPQSHDNVLGVQGTGEVTDQDYHDILIPQLEELLKKFGKVRFLYYLDKDFTGWEMGAMWEDTKFGLRHKDEFEKMAVVGAPAWAAWAIKLFGYFMEGQAKIFSLEELQAAWDWVNS